MQHTRHWTTDLRLIGALWCVSKNTDSNMESIMIEEELLEGTTTCDECNNKVHYNENGYECSKCGHGCC